MRFVIMNLQIIFKKDICFLNNYIFFIILQTYTAISFVTLKILPLFSGIKVSFLIIKRALSNKTQLVIDRPAKSYLKLYK